MHRVKQVRYMHDYTVELVFKSGEVRYADLTPYVGGEGLFDALTDLGYFKQVAMNEVGNSICWPNGVDFCPNLLYDISFLVGEEKTVLG